MLGIDDIPIHGICIKSAGLFCIIIRKYKSADSSMHALRLKILGMMEVNIHGIPIGIGFGKIYMDSSRLNTSVPRFF
jgi:hypothetical protein